MSINYTVQRIVKDKRSIVSEAEGVSLSRCYKRAWETILCSYGFVLDIEPNSLSLVRRMYDSPGELEKTTFTPYSGNADDLNVLKDLAFVHRYITSYRMGVIRDEVIPEHLVSVLKTVKDIYQPARSVESIFYDAFLLNVGMPGLISRTNAIKREATFMYFCTDYSVEAILNKYINQ